MTGKVCLPVCDVIKVQEGPLWLGEFRVTVSETVKRGRMAGLTLRIRETCQIEFRAPMFVMAGGTRQFSGFRCPVRCRYSRQLLLSCVPACLWLCLQPIGCMRKVNRIRAVR